MPRPGRGRAAGTPGPVPGWWLAVWATAVAVVAAAALGRLWGMGLVFGPLLAIPAALAGIGARALRLPLACGALMLAAAVVLAAFSRGLLWWVAVPVPVVGVTALTALGVTLNRRGKHERPSVAPVEQKLADVTSVADVVQRALLPPLPGRVGPLELQVVYLAAAAEARVGGDLYEVARTPYGIRMIMGDVRGKGLGAVEVAADVLGVFREAVHEVYTLAEVARRLDASLARRQATNEEFVTAVLVEIDPVVNRLTLYNCGHPAPILLVPARGADWSPPEVKVAVVPAPAPPLGLMSLGDCSGAGLTLPFNTGDEMLLYTDGITEARDADRRFYPLAERLAVLVQEGTGQALLERLREDVLRHRGAPLDDDAALLLVRATGVLTAGQDGAVSPLPLSLPQASQPATP